MKVITGFKEFIARGNVVELAVAVVIGAAFTTLVNSMVKDLMTPLIAAILGKTDFSSLAFTIRGSDFTYGNFINALIAFFLSAAAVYFFVVAPMNAYKEHASRDEAETHRDCPECLSEVPVKATRCAFCTSELEPPEWEPGSASRPRTAS